MMKSQFFLSTVFLSLSVAAHAQVSAERLEYLSSSVQVRHEEVTASVPTERVTIPGQPKEYFSEAKPDSAKAWGNSVLNRVLMSDINLLIEKITSATLPEDQVEQLNHECGQIQKELLFESIKALQGKSRAIDLLSKPGAHLTITVSDRAQIADWEKSDGFKAYVNELRRVELEKIKAKKSGVKYYQSNGPGSYRLAALARPPSLSAVYGGKLNLKVQANVVLDPKTREFTCQVMSAEDLGIFWRMVDLFDPEQNISTYMEKLDKSKE